MQYDYDILIVGGGLAGNCLALALKESGLRIALVEASSREQQKQSPAGDRALALSAGTVKLLQALDAWDGVKEYATAIKNIHISDRGHFGKARLSAKKEGVEALGYVISGRNIEGHLAELVEKTNIKQICPGRILTLISDGDAVQVNLKETDKPISLSVKLLVGADGGQSTVRSLLEIPQHITQYQQTALITTVRTSIPHNNTAFERFTKSGPLAVLPVNNKECSIVWTRTEEDAEDLMSSTEAEFLQQLQQCFGYVLGELTLSAPRRAFPLSLIQAENMVSGRTVIIGNAVHQLHPVAGQGFNLGVRDVVQLAEMLVEQQQKKADIGEPSFLQRYVELREKDHKQTIQFTDGLVKIFSTDWLPLAAARSISLAVLDHIPFAKSMLAKHAMGLAGRLPRIGHRR
ncbi:MAG: 2-octaprenyl-6-methoxyphenyl hydroxylase [Methylococcales symbiont of Iophon sp. n. MRB-2018]|nr:MAG: 2-octaprenyl-6-methoxyphenyl hydroxylase [Methylococcales symbiont of Iophon sp. n. MRB-2018]KAF3979271.1 MAG: 2-octaprenyl-6-methoxyphenyl hydroxylase [Methylococcales symbiont of Iophon sp. n. MRB-2018]